MKGNIFSRLWIPKPCHEDWNKMTPDEKGAFCRSCNKSVYDFTGKDEQQVEAILTAASGEEVCGRFESTQLGALPELEIPIHALPRNLSPYRKFLLAVFIVFGTALFGCVNSYGQKMGKVKLVTKSEPVVIKEEEYTLKGEVAYIPEDTLPQQVIVDVLGNEQPDAQAVSANVSDSSKSPALLAVSDYVLGGLSYVSYQEDAANTDEPAEMNSIDPEEIIQRIECGLIVTDEEDITGENMMITGQVSIITGGVPVNYGDVNSHLVTVTNPQDSNDESVITDAAGDDWDGRNEDQDDADENSSALTGGDGVKPSIECYPNPSDGPVTIRYEIKKRCDVRMELFDYSGKKVRTLIDQKGYYNGIYNTAFDLSELDAGTYICVLQADGNVSSAKVVIAK